MSNSPQTGNAVATQLAIDASAAAENAASAMQAPNAANDAATNATPTTTAPAPTFVAPPKNDDVAAPARGGKAYLVVKRAFDIVFSLAVCIILAIPTAILCLIIVIDNPGAPIFRQKRVGLNGKTIRIFKLRTMVPDAHTNPQKYMTPQQHARWLREQKLDNDPRITRVGRLLREVSLDELPQFINVLTGDLSVIGPRPVTLEETYEFGNARDEFLSCKPGITGWWQVISRNDSTWADGSRQMIELFYVRHASIALDARIFWKTFKAMKKGQ